MNSRVISLILLVVTVAILVAVGWMVWGLFPEPVERRVAGARLVTNTVTQIAVRKINATNLLGVLTGRPWGWSSLESTNYAAYISNLRAFGCPEETIRDIIITDIAKLYARRRAALREQLAPYKFWRSEEFNADGANYELHLQLRALEREQRDFVTELLGIDYRAEMAKYWADDDQAQRRYGFLPEEKQAQIQSLLRQYDDLEDDINFRARGLYLEADEAELARLQEERQAELAALLTPAELEEYQLRNSELAENLRGQLAGFDTTEEEFRKIFRLQKTFETEFDAAFNPADETAMALRAQAEEDAQAALDSELERVLGADRFVEYRRSVDPDYKGLVQITERFEMPREVANRVYDMKVFAERQRQVIEANPAISEDQRRIALAAVAQETERSVAGVLGDQVFDAYQKAAGQWMANLGVAPEPLPEPEPEPLPSGPPLPPTFPWPFPFPYQQVPGAPVPPAPSGR